MSNFFALSVIFVFCLAQVQLYAHDVPKPLLIPTEDRDYKYEWRNYLVAEEYELHRYMFEPINDEVTARLVQFEEDSYEYINELNVRAEPDADLHAIAQAIGCSLVPRIDDSTYNTLRFGDEQSKKLYNVQKLKSLDEFYHPDIIAMYQERRRRFGGTSPC